MRKIKTICFIGSDKNAGKTTALNFVYSKIKDKIKNIIFLSIGINGESYDSLEGHAKPKIKISKNHFFVTEYSHLRKHEGKYETVEIYTPPTFKKVYVLAKALLDISVILEGPNEKREIIKIKDKVSKLFQSATILLDGSIDRQFIASKEISDEFYFSMLITNRKEQIKKLNNLVRPLNYKVVDPKLMNRLKKHINSDIKSVFLNKELELIYKGKNIPFLDEELLNHIKTNHNKITYLYLDGAVTTKLTEKLAPYKKLNLILDNFTQELSVNIPEFKENIKNKMLFNQITLNGIFLKEETNIKPDILLPEGIPTFNIFREEALDDIRI